MRCLAQLIFLAISTLFYGCASYGWAAPPDQAEGRSYAVQVETVAAPAHLGLHTSELRGLLIHELELAGATVQAGHSTTEAILRCNIHDLRSHGLGTQIHTDLQLDCQLIDAESLHPLQGFTARGTGASLSLTQAEKRASINAINLVLPTIIDALESRGEQP